MARLTTTRLAVLVLLSLAAHAADAQPPSTADATPATVLPHPDDTRWWLSGQLNLIAQGHRAFPSPYDGPHSLQSDGEHAVSRLWTVHMGYRVADHTEAYVDMEAAGGEGLSSALGLGGFTNLDVVRNPDLGAAPYVGRTMVHQTVPLTGTTVAVERGPFGLASTAAARRIEIWAGKMTLADFLDTSGPGSDSHLQFTNWTVDNNGAWDYAADTRGYTFGVVAEVVWPRWTVRVGEALMPTVANGLTLDRDVAHARGDNVEVEARFGHGLVIRSLVFVNHARMGSYAEANAAALAAGRAPIIEDTRLRGRRKTGVGENVEWAVSRDARLFGRLGWNDGRNESYAYTEVDQTAAVGGDLTGRRWGRTLDRAGLALVSNGLSADHRDYLRLGGLGFLLGDGTLRYGRETIAEAYYTAHLWRGVFTSAGVQHILDPGYNRDRGPVTVGMARLHVDF